MLSLEAAIARSIAGWDQPFVELAVFGTADPAHIAEQVEAFCARELRARPTHCLRWSASVGVAIGLALDDGRSLLVKCHQPDVSKTHLGAVHTLRRRLFACGYPTPEPIMGPTPLCRGLATVERYVEGAPAPNGFDPQVRVTLATGLAHLVSLATELGVDLALDEAGIDVPHGDALWPKPHSALFDFAATARGAEPIDALARRAKEALVGDPTATVIGHRDYRVEHVRLAGDHSIAVVYDWESMVRSSEARMVGWASVNWPANWATGYQGRRTASPIESDQFVADYEDARGATFDARARSAIGATRLYALCYAARCGHRPDQPPIPGAAEAALQRYGDAYLRVSRPVA